MSATPQPKSVRAAQLVRAGFIVSILLFIALAVISKTMIEPAGMVIFDSRIGGYALPDAQAFLQAITPEQRATYLGLFRQIDTVFPVLLAVSLLGFVGLNTKGEARQMRLAALLGPVLYLLFDLLENARVASILLAGPQLQSGLVDTAATFTQAKWMCLALSLLVTLWAWRFANKGQVT